MRVIITGGTGLIGTALAKSLVNDGHEVVVLTRAPKQNTDLPSSVRLEHWDTKTAAGWGALADGAGAIVNFAGANLAGEGFLPSRWTPERKKLIRDSRINAGQAVVEAIKAAQNKPSVVIQASAVGYYGPQGDQDITEDAPPADDFAARVCVDWEKSTEEVEAMGVRRVIARTGIVCSFKGGALPRMALPFKFFAGGPLGSGKQQYPWIHIDDEVAAIRWLMENPEASGPFNLSAPNPLPNAEFARALGKAMGRPSLIPTPAFVFELAFGEVASIILTGQRAIPKRLLDHGFQFRYPQAEDALRDLYQNNK